MIKNKVRTCREKLGYTQAELADRTNLSVRTIQRVESGETIPKGYTLKVLSEVLGIEKEAFFLQEPSLENLKAKNKLNLKAINLCALFFIGIPLGNIFIPLMIWKKYNGSKIIEEVGRRIINFQIIWTITTYLLLIISPFLQDLFPSEITLILVVGLLAMLVNIFVIIRTAIAINASNYDVLSLKISLI